jgi:hypothetical protein
MKRSHAVCIALASCLLLVQGVSAPANTDNDDERAAEAGGGPQLNSEQQRAVGIAVAHPIAAANIPGRLAALGSVLDATLLLSDLGETTAAEAAEKTSAAELTRLRDLYRGGTSASLKVLEAAEAEHARLQAQLEVTSARLSLRWQPVASLSGGERQKLVESLTKGGALLVRADLLGRHSIGVVPREALLDVDGVQVHGHVLGLVKQSTELQSIGLLVEVPRAPLGLGPGARVPVALLIEGRPGLLLPRASILYDENGAYVYKQLAPKPGEKTTRYAVVRVKLLTPNGDGWVVEGVDDDDNIVVHGAAVLWSLQGVGVHGSADEDDDED